MRAGSMKYRLRIFKPVESSDNWGAESPQYKEVRTVYAERVKISGSRRMEVGELFPDYRVEFNIRYEHPVEENWRVEQIGGHLFNVTNVIPNIDRGMKTLVCERVNN